MRLPDDIYSIFLYFIKQKGVHVLVQPHHVNRALEQIAEAMGHSNSNPLSTSLLCLEHGISFDEMGKIMVAFNQILCYTKNALQLNFS